MENGGWQLFREQPKMCLVANEENNKQSRPSAVRAIHFWILFWTKKLKIIGDFSIMFTGVEDLGHSASAAHPEDCWLLSRDLKSHSSLYFNEARRCPFISWKDLRKLVEGSEAARRLLVVSCAIWSLSRWRKNANWTFCIALEQKLESVYLEEMSESSAGWKETALYCG